MDRKKYRILISQPKPSNIGSPYLRLGEVHDLDFKRFARVIPISTEKFCKYKSLIPKHTAIIFTGKGVIDHFFSLCNQVSLTIPSDMKYFCISNQTANYLQKYIQLRKRRVFVGNKIVSDLFPFFKKYRKEKYILPCSEIKNPAITTFFKNSNLKISHLTILDPVFNNFSDIDVNKYDIITFFSPSDVKSFFASNKKIDESKVVFATFGINTENILKDAGFQSIIHAPTLLAPSIAKAIENFISQD